MADFAPQVEGRVRVDARSAKLGDEEAAGLQGLVTDEFRLQAKARTAGEEAVGRILFQELVRGA